MGLKCETSRRPSHWVGLWSMKCNAFRGTTTDGSLVAGLSSVVWLVIVLNEDTNRNLWASIASGGANHMRKKQSSIVGTAISLLRRNKAGGRLYRFVGTGRALYFRQHSSSHSCMLETHKTVISTHANAMSTYNTEGHVVK